MCIQFDELILLIFFAELEELDIRFQDVLRVIEPKMKLMLILNNKR